jgi:protein gp37
MNRTRIEWTDYTWNPITGCLHGCSYCYARKITARFPKVFPYGFEPHFYPDRLIEPSMIKIPSKIFTVSMGDMFGEWVPQQWISDIFYAMKESPHHTFQILTKNPGRINRTVSGDMYSPNIWLGTSVEGADKAQRISELLKVPRFMKFASFEPLQSRIFSDLAGLGWVILGAQTNPLKYPSSEAIQSVLYRAKELPVFFKDSLRGCPWITDQMFRQEYPKSVCRMSG